jgi:hypothetical protein
MSLRPERLLLGLILGLVACGRMAESQTGPTPTSATRNENDVAVGFATALLANDLEGASKFLCAGVPPPLPLHRSLRDAEVTGPPEKRDRGLVTKSVPKPDLFVPFEATQMTPSGPNRVDGQVEVIFGRADDAACVCLHGAEIDPLS